MGRTKSNAASSSGSAPNNLTNGTTAESNVTDLLKELHQLIHKVQDERSHGENNLTNVAKTHERVQQEQKLSQYYRSKLKNLYNIAMQDAENEAECLRKALAKISELKTIRESKNGDRPKQIMRRGVLMNLLQQNAVTLPLWIGKPSEKPPPLCGAIPAEANYIAKSGDKVAARVKGQDGEENWILAEVSSYNGNTNKYEVDDIDAEEGKERHVLSKRRVVPLPIWKGNPETDPEAVFPKDTSIYALYPQTTCFYIAIVFEPPKRPQDDYLVLFEDTSYPEGYSPPLGVAQRYVIVCKEDKKK